MASNLHGSSMSLDLNSTGLHRTRTSTMSLTDLVDELVSPSKAAASGVNLTPAAMAMTPTTTQFLFPTTVTAEQEAYASGFMSALEELHRAKGQLANQPKMVTSGNVIPPAASSQLTTLNNVHVERYNSFSCVPSQSLATTGICSNTIWPAMKNEVPSDTPPTLLGGQAVKTNRSNLPIMNCGNGLVFSPQVTAVSSSSFPRYSSPVPALPVANNDNVSEQNLFAPVCAPYVSSRAAAADSTVSGSLAKLDMNDQDQRRLERKRAKNRVAAARCQMRKMERITRLQEKAQELRNNNARLSRTVAELNSHVSSLRNQITMHTERGCRMMIPSLS